MGDDSGGLEHVVDNDTTLSDIDVSSKVFLTTVLTLVDDSYKIKNTIKALPVASSHSVDDHGLNLGLSLIRNEFAGFTGIALITTPYVKSTIPLVNKTKVNGKVNTNSKGTSDSVVLPLIPKNSYSCMKIPREYVGQNIISRKKLSEIPASDVVSFKYYCFNPDLEDSCKNIYTDLENDLIASNFCDREMAPIYVLGVTDALRTHKPLHEWNKQSARVYLLCVDSKPNKDTFSDTCKESNVAPPKNAKNIYVLRCWTHGTNHLNL